MLERRSVSVGGALVSYLSVKGGTKGTVIFLHGWRSEGAVWSAAMASVGAEGFTAYALDLPGFGSSEDPARPFPVHDYAAVVASFMDKLDIPSATIVGHSFGGRVGIVLAAEHAMQVRKLVLVDAAGIRPPSVRRAVSAFIAKILKPFFSPHFMQPARRVVYRMLGAEDYLATPALVETFKRIVGEDLSPLFPKIAQETLLFWGEKDTDTPLSFAEAMQKDIPHTTLVVVPGAGHFSFIDAPEEFFAALKPFIV